jgi:hypothetical protein
MTERFFTDIWLDLHIGVNCRHGLRQSHAGVQSPLKATLDRVDGPDAWDGDRAAVVSQAVLASLSKGGLPGSNLCHCLNFTAAAEPSSISIYQRTKKRPTGKLHPR